MILAISCMLSLCIGVNVGYSSSTSQFDVAHKTDNYRKHARQFLGKFLAVGYIYANIGNKFDVRELPESRPVQCGISQISHKGTFFTVYFAIIASQLALLVTTNQGNTD